MYIDRSRFDEYSFTGQFYTVNDNMPADGDVLNVKDEVSEDGDFFADGDDDNPTQSGEGGDTPATQSTTTEEIPLVETVVFETKCDIQETDKMMATDTAGSYLDIFFPFELSEGVPVRIGHRFRSNDWFRPVDGRVYAVVPSPMGGCKARIKEVGIDELKQIS